MWSEVDEEILYEMRTELQVYLMSSTFVFINNYISVKSYNKLLNY